MRLAAVARRQGGVFTREQAVAYGFTRRQIAGRVRSGVWVRVQRWVYAAASTPLTLYARHVAALLSCGRRAMFFSLSAARAQGIDVRGGDDCPRVLLPYESGSRRLDAAIVARTRDLPTPVLCAGWPATPPGRTVFDLAKTLPPAELAATIHGALRSSVLDLEELTALADTMTGGHAGARALRSVLAAYDVGAESAAEAYGQRLLRRAGITLTAQVEVWDGPFLVARLDLADEKLKVAVEIDGPHHQLGSHPSRDRRRDRHLVALGWLVLRFTTEDLYARPRAFVAEVAAAVERRLAVRS